MTNDKKEIINVTLKILLIMGSIEFLIMLFAPVVMHDLNHKLFALVDALILIFVSTPIIVFWVVKPYVRLHNQALAEAKFIALHDPLTKLPNRRLLTEHIDKCLSISLRNDIVGALIFIDLDGFKHINDNNGHAMGDQVLIEVAERLRKTVRNEDIVSRHGGDEFIIFLQDTGVDIYDAKLHILKVINKIRARISKPIEIGEQAFQVDCSFGVNVLSGNWVSTALAIHEADTAMYQAKKSQDSKVVFSDDIVINWYSSIKTGISEIDREHQQLDFLMQSFIESTEDRIGHLHAVADALKKHFQSEEWISIQKSLNMSEKHKQEHRRLEKLLGELTCKLDSSNMLDGLKFIQQVIHSHIAAYDSHLARDIVKKNLH